ncbi:sugar ABC transporter ATP-binding protein [Mesorhizobium sp. NZP2298]|uniref:sugar ABC transporter ATP-binding protein n=1 Tax=Mesorhizobium sp. NZP2298 TaxID=2483403 RepID=UPI00155769EE|nr:sugar ABC transporter ATP-binding protein [Mesorhizobium sp. NZP2298]QKC93766.1 sugar ABC transporter ATP-binding protein [Mesorhizobium sp. NZP2298]
MMSPAHTSHSPAYALRGMGKSFGGIFACRGVDIEVNPSEVIAIAGENGAGKSTTVKCLYGLYAPDEGFVEIAGQRVRMSSPREGEAHGISMIPQELDLFPELSIVENLFVGRDRPRTFWGGFDWAAMRRRASEILASLGVSFDVTLPVRALSAANGKLVEVARALNREARLIIMDEPTAALTEREADRLFSVVRGLTAKGVSVIYITHRLDEIFQISDRIVVLRDGGMVTSGPTRDFTVASLVQAMVGRSLDQLYARRYHVIGADILSVEGLSRTGSFRDISFTLRGGEILGISGLIGAGRSELARAIYGFDPADSGTILVDGKPVRIRSVKGALAQGIAYLPEERRSQGLILPMSIAGNISFAILGRLSRLGFVARRRERAFALESSRRFRIVGAELEAPVEVLSGGNQQKVLLAKTLASDPRIIILDEPARGVDIGAKAEIYALIEGLAQAGKGVVLISSEMNEVLSLSDRILVMHEGSITGAFDRDQFSAEAIGAAAAGQEYSHVA